MIPRKKGRDFASIRSIMHQVLKTLEPRSGRNLQDLEAVWRGLVGEELGSMSSVALANERTVEIRAESSAVLAELEQFYRDQFLQRLREAGIAGIDRAIFRLCSR